MFHNFVRVFRESYALRPTRSYGPPFIFCPYSVFRQVPPLQQSVDVFPDLPKSLLDSAVSFGPMVAPKAQFVLQKPSRPFPPLEANDLSLAPEAGEIISRFNTNDILQPESDVKHRKEDFLSCFRNENIDVNSDHNLKISSFNTAKREPSVFNNDLVLPGWPSSPHSLIVPPGQPVSRECEVIF